MTTIPKIEAKTLRNQQLFLDAFGHTLGNISKACEKARVSRQTHYRWLKDDPDYERRFEDAEEALIDNMRQCLYKAASTNWKAAIEVLERLRPREWNKALIVKEASVEDWPTDYSITINGKPLSILVNGNEECFEKLKNGNSE